jgi:hypothetical protein
MMKQLGPRALNLYVQCQRWIKASPAEALQLLGILLAALTALTAFACFLIFRQQATPPPAPPAVGVTTTTGWEFVARVPVGKDYCDMYSKGGISRSKCYTRTKEGTWRFNNVY